MGKKSKCCNADVREVGRNKYVCKKCGKPCEVKKKGNLLISLIKYKASGGLLK